MSESPFLKKSYTEIYDEILDHIVNGNVKVCNEAFTASGVGPYTLSLNNEAAGALLEVNRVHGERDDSFKEFAETTDYTVDLTNKQITFQSGKDPDADTKFYGDYRYDQGYSSGITDVTPGSVVSTIISSIARRIAGIWDGLEDVKEGASIEDAKGDDLDELVAILGVIRNVASKASGYVTFYRDSPSGPDTIPSGTIVGTIGTVGSPAMLFETTQAVDFLDGFTSARAPIQAVSGYEGKQGNVRPGTITRLLGQSPATRVANPIEYWNSEFIELTDGNYTYVLTYFPKRTFTSQGSSLIVCNYIDEDVSDWTPTDCTVTPDEPDIGVTKLANTGAEGAGYIEITGLSVVRDTYGDAAIRVRGTVGNHVRVSVQYDDTTWLEQVIDEECTLDWSLEIGQPSTGSNLTGIRIYPYEASSVIYVDFIVLGKKMTEQTTAPPITDNSKFICSYTQKLIALRYVDEVDNFFEYDQGTISYDTQTANFEIGEKVTSDATGATGIIIYDDDQGDYGTLTLGSVTGTWQGGGGEMISGDKGGSAQSMSILHFTGYSADDKLLPYYLSLNQVTGGTDMEADDALRQRAKYALEVAAKGTKNAILSAVLDVDGVYRCQVIDHDDDINIALGKVNVLVTSQGFTISPALQEEIIVSIDAARAAGIRVDVFQPSVRYTNFTLVFTYDDAREELGTSTGLSTLREEVASMVNDYFTDIDIGETLQFAHLIGMIVTDFDEIVGGYVAWSVGEMDYDAQTAEFTEGAVLTGSTSGATAIIIGDEEGAGDTGTLTLVRVQGTFVDGEEITDDQGGDADVDGVIPISWIHAVKISDDDYSGTYEFDSDIVKDQPQRVKGTTADKVAVVQRGNYSNEQLITLEAKSIK